MTPEQHYAEAEALAQQGGGLRVDSNPSVYLATALLACTHALLAQGDPADLRGNDDPRPVLPPGDDPRSGHLLPAASTSMGRDGWLLCLLIAAVVLGVTWLVTR